MELCKSKLDEINDIQEYNQQKMIKAFHITLDTERRQKEVAIRKINGAGIKQIILLFSRLYMLLLTTSALLAFPVVYVILHMWKEIYQIFFNDGILYWVGIFVGVTLLTALTVIFRILRIVRLNPAEVIKNE